MPVSAVYYCAKLLQCKNGWIKDAQAFFLPCDEADFSSIQGRDLRNSQIDDLPNSIL